MTQAIKENGWVLVDDRTGLDPVLKGAGVMNFRGETRTITGGRPPHTPNSTGKVWTQDGGEYYPSVFGLKWINE